jgi:hypothetical protein
MNSASIIEAVTKVTGKWAKQRKSEERAQSKALRRSEAWSKPTRVTVKSAAYQFMEKAYMLASGNNTYPAHARQVMYAARDYIQSKTGRPFDDAYFTQTLLPDFIKENPESTKGWDVVFDARGHLWEPHTEREVPLGTVDVRDYLSNATSPVPLDDLATDRVSSHYPTHGPRARYSALLFIEKEGFMPLFRKIRLAERYDIAIMSTKGLSNTSSRSLVDTLCGQAGIPLLVLHDFDKSGLSILGTLHQDTRRFSFANEIRIMDLGIRLADAKENDLKSEECYHTENPTFNLRKNGATDEEIEVLRGKATSDGYCGRRVELNAFASDKFVSWIEAKLNQHGVKKLVPDQSTLEDAFRRATAAKYMNDQLDEIEKEAAKHAKDIAIPADLSAQVERKLGRDRAIPWDVAVADIAGDAGE